MTKQIFPFFILLHKLHRLILPPLPPRTNSNPSPSALTLRPKDFVACGSARRVKDSIKQKGFTRAFLIKPLVLPSAHTYALSHPP